MTAMTIQARPTTYRGIPMRSRLEASVAAELDQLVDLLAPSGEVGSWAYEERAFASQDGQYLPDFRFAMPTISAPWFIEAKPTLEAVLAVLGRMQIIWDSEPTAFLSVAMPIDGEICFALSASGDGDRTWRIGGPRW